jgi:hypothetical protein
VTAAFGGLCLCALSAQAAPAWSSQVERWGIEEVTLKGKHGYANPFTDVTLAASFNCPGQTATVSGFYDGNGTWKVRFMPENTGNCTFTTKSSDAVLNGVSGSFNVRPADAKNHGPVKVAKTFHFSYADGTPFFPLGTTSYNWLNRDTALQEKTLAALKHSGFTKIRFGLFPKWYVFNHVEPAVFPYVRKPDGSFDFDRFDPRFFVNVEHRLKQLEAMGIQADIILFHPYDHWGFATMDQAHNEAWLRYVVARLSAYRNVWWTMANEYDLMTPRDWNDLGNVVHNSDPYGHPLGIHNAGAWFDPTSPWINHVIIQDGSPTAGLSASIARMRYGKPVVVDEYGYEGNNAQMWGELSGREEVERHWDITMAGAYASHGETYVHPNGVLWWAAGGDLVGEAPSRLAFLKTVMTSLPFQDMVPSPQLVVNGTALAKPGEAYLFRFAWDPKSFVTRPSQVRLAGADLFKVELIDPWQMKVYSLGYTAPGDQGFTMQIVPSLLRITAAAKGAGEPRPIGDLIGAFSGNPSSAYKANPSLFTSGQLYYSVDFHISLILQNPAAKAVLEKYMPKSVLTGGITGLPLSALPTIMPTISQSTVEQIQSELAKIPVE